ncbi:small-conductance mechanosensitive channel [Dongia mobilis]|uniref:Small-conductance mechanosensitive channel n=1 Tax=Dongia mobilis TaxID=578943 RepID=A0A4R6WUK9_9PROT|nr:mechanosensitive ion channel family protein [Dongia mobilis]TDQ82966.1 small-conductance mechanosensitive channel [Dongia mobilis]
MKIGVFNLRTLRGLARCRRQLIAGFGILFLVLATPSIAQEAMPEKVQELLRLMDDPAVREWVAQQTGETGVQPASPTSAGMMQNPAHFMDQRLREIRQHIDGIIAAVPNVSGEMMRLRDRLILEMADHGVLETIALIFAFLGLGLVVELVYWRATRGAQTWIVGVDLESSTERLRAAGVRLAFSVGVVLSFAIGSVGAFLAFDWPALLREIVLAYLVAFLVTRLALAIARFALAPGGERFRLVPMPTPAAWFWYRRIGVAVAWLCIAWVTVALLQAMDVMPPVRKLIAYALGLVLLAIGLEAVWRRPGPASSADGDRGGERRRLKNALVSVYFAVLWLLWVASAMPLFSLAVVVVALPSAIRLVRRSVNHILRPGDGSLPAQMRGLAEVSLDRGLRAVLIIAAALLLARAWDIDLVAMTMQDTLATRILRGILSAIVIILIAEFLWHALRAMIDSQLQSGANHEAAQAGDETSRRRARLRTLLPILRNVLFIVILVIAVLMVLSSLGIEIGPLIAGAGVVGVAVGFGAQTLVKDVISGMFYLLDDAFRVGEYIQSGSYKGTVESFSLRSVKLRHHRGPLYTVPFGELGAVQNMSRDWVIDKLTIGITYDSDLDKARKLIKEVGKELAADPEFAPHILEPMKMQGVEQFGDFAIQIRVKMMTKPGEQFTIRRKALAMIRKAFNENGIHFAFPTVQVAGGGGSGDAAVVAAAKQAVDHATPGLSVDGH